jgi:DNA mismatch endonuclease (patch repair protein)
VFVHGCFWHSHGCYRTVAPKTRPEFWSIKLGKNQQRDKRDVVRLAGLGWRVCIVWECALTGKTAPELNDVVRSLTVWLHTDKPFSEISGTGISKAA